MQRTHIIVFSCTSSWGTLVVGSIHHVTSHFKETLLENNEKSLQHTYVKWRAWISVTMSEQLSCHYYVLNKWSNYSTSSDTKTFVRWQTVNIHFIYFKIKVCSDNSTEHSSVWQCSSYNCKESIFKYIIWCIKILICLPGWQGNCFKLMVILHKSWHRIILA